MTPLLLIVIVIGWLFVSTYSIIIGVQMIVNPRYRSYFADLWFRSSSKQDKEQHELSVRLLGGPLYILIGMSFLVYGIWTLDLAYGILNDFVTLRSVVNFFVQ